MMDHVEVSGLFWTLMDTGSSVSTLIISDQVDNTSQLQPGSGDIGVLLWWSDAMQTYNDPVHCNPACNTLTATPTDPSSNFALNAS